MATRAKRLATNVEGDFYVDSTCIDCGACRWVAPESFTSTGDYSSVTTQPQSDTQILRSEMALLACPTGSIGTLSKHDLIAARAAFPEPITDSVRYVGYHHEDSFGAAPWLIIHPIAGNLLIDSPRFTGEVVRSLEALGGIRWMLLTHRDDVADHQQFRDHFACERVIHARDAKGTMRGTERIIEGDGAFELVDGITLIPTPGHTAGSMCFLWEDVLFTGDHLAWSRRLNHLIAFHDACWCSWSLQIASMERLVDYAFAHVLPGHGTPAHLPAIEMAQSLGQCIAWMKEQ